MEIMYVNKSNIELTTTAFYGDILDLIDMGVDIDGIEYDDNWTVKKFLSNSLLAKKRIETVFKYLDIDTKYLNWKIKELSKVTFKYVLLSHALLNNQKTIVFERFDVGLSNKEKKNMYQIIKKLKNDGLTLIFITKDLLFANQVADNIIVIKNKKEVFNGKIEDLIKSKKNIVNLPPIIKFIEYANSKKAGLDVTLDHKELLKDIYRSVC
jgi:energy-coupling factor transporter ATP-binding protein EcfA2